MAKFKVVLERIILGDLDVDAGSYDDDLQPVEEGTARNPDRLFSSLLHRDWYERNLYVEATAFRIAAQGYRASQKDRLKPPGCKEAWR
jgi:hypothetical protein